MTAHQSDHATLYSADCLDVLRQLPDQSVNVIIADPPYGVSYQSNWSETTRFRKIKNDGQPFVWWFYDAYRVLADPGCMLCFCRWDVAHDFGVAIRWAGFDLRSEVIWDRCSHGMGNLKGAFAPQHDTIWFATKGKYVFPDKRPHDVLRHQRVPAQQMIHPTEKPLPLMADLVQSVATPGQTILDPFMGSGVTGEAAIKFACKFIGVELDPEYFELAKRRIEVCGTRKD